MEFDRLARLFPPQTRVYRRGRGGGVVEGLAQLPAGPVIYVHWDAVKYWGDDGRAIPWREAVSVSDLARFNDPSTPAYA